jgi:hypothetical protein
VSVVTSCSKFVDLLFAVTLAPLIAAWLGSVTTPLKLESVPCAEMVKHTVNTTAMVINTR